MWAIGSHGVGIFVDSVLWCNHSLHNLAKLLLISVQWLVCWNTNIALRKDNSSLRYWKKIRKYWKLAYWLIENRKKWGRGGISNLNFIWLLQILYFLEFPLLEIPKRNYDFLKILMFPNISENIMENSKFKNN